MKIVILTEAVVGASGNKNNNKIYIFNNGPI